MVLKKLSTRYVVGLALISLAVLAVIVYFVHYYPKPRANYPNPVEPNNKSVSQGPTSPSKGEASNNAPATQNQSTSNLLSPSGSFVSNHKPTLVGTPGPKEQSICVTSPGASCVITFSQGSLTKTLGAKSTDQTGSASWSWSLQDLGITNGSWTITATAKSGDQSKSVIDPILLEVQ